MHNPILTLRNLVQEAALASTPEKRARGIVSRVKGAMNAAVCSLYVADDNGILKLVATDGLNPEVVGKIMLQPGEGLVGLIAQTQHPVNLECASAHPRYRYFPESGEERYEAFLGAPIVHAGQLFGVLVVEQKPRRFFSENEESFLVTVAAHLGALSPRDFLAVEEATSSETAQPTRRLSGLGASPGIGIGTIVLLSNELDLMTVLDSECNDPDLEVKRFQGAVAATLDDLAESKRQLADGITNDLAQVFTVYEMLLQGADFTGAVERRIGAGSSAASALRSAVAEYVARFEAMDEAYFRARSEDIRVLGSRVYGHLTASVRQEPPEDDQVVLVGGLVSIADIANYPAEQIAGIVCEEGSTLSHTALLAKALGIPAVMGIGPHGDVAEGEVAIVDGYHGRAVISPSAAVLDEFTRLIEHGKLVAKDLAKLRDLPAITPDGHQLDLLANTGLLADITPGLAQGAKGIGLYRSEIPFLVRPAFPSEEEQREVYRTVLEAYHGLPVYMRTLDVGGDKPLPYYPFNEENPALGWRGIRFSLDNSAVLMTQVRAMLHASEGLDNLRIMLPMVTRVEEVRAFRTLLDSAYQQLAEEGVELRRPQYGIMAEVPAVRAILPFLEGMIDFVSIGSNDLTQYLLAVDRSNVRVASLFDHLHPGVIAELEALTRTCRDLDLAVCVCGDMASDPCGAVLLMGMGIRAMSMPAFSIPRIKWLIRTIEHHEAVSQLETARRSASAGETRAALREFLMDRGLGDLLEPVTPEN